MTENDSLLQLAQEALQKAANGVVEEARRTGGEIVVWENGAVRHIPASQLPPPGNSASASKGAKSPLPPGEV